MPDIGFSTGLVVRGTTQTDDWSAGRVPAQRTYSEPWPDEYAPDFIALGGSTTYTTINEFDVVLSGNTTGVVLEPLSPKLRFVGNHAEMVDGGGENVPYRVRGPYHYRDYTVPLFTGVRTDTTPRTSLTLRPDTPLAICDGLVRSYIAGKSPGAATQDVWSSASYTGTLSATPNPTNAFAALMPQLACVSFTSSRHGRIFPAVLLGARVAVCADHVGHQVGDTLTWRRTDGSFASSTVAERYSLEMYGTPADMGLLLLSTAVTGVPFGRTLPADVFDWFPGLDLWRGRGIMDGRNNAYVTVLAWMANAGTGPDTPTGTNIINTDSPHLRLARIRWLYSSTLIATQPAGTSLATVVSSAMPAGDPAAAWSQLAYGGDSSAPYFMVTPSGPALLVHLWSATAGPSVVAFAATIAAKAIERGFAPAGWAVETVPMTGLTKPT